MRRLALVLIACPMLACAFGPLVRNMMLEIASRRDVTPVPLTVEGLALWLDVSQLEGASNNDLISSLPDLSGNERDFYQNVSGERPTYKANYHNGLAVLDTTAGHLQHDSVIVYGSANRTTFVVAAQNAAESRPGPLGIGRTSALSGFSLLMEYSFRFGGANIIYQESPALQTFKVVTGLLDGDTVDDCKAYVDGTELARSTTANPTLVLATGEGIEDADFIWFGRYQSSIDERFPGVVGEVLLYDRALPQAEREKIENYLMDKWGH